MPSKAFSSACEQADGMFDEVNAKDFTAVCSMMKLPHNNVYIYIYVCVGWVLSPYRLDLESPSLKWWVGGLVPKQPKELDNRVAVNNDWASHHMWQQVPAISLVKIEGWNFRFQPSVFGENIPTS